MFGSRNVLKISNLFYCFLSPQKSPATFNFPVTMQILEKVKKRKTLPFLLNAKKKPKIRSRETIFSLKTSRHDGVSTKGLLYLLIWWRNLKDLPARPTRYYCHQQINQLINWVIWNMNTFKRLCTFVRGIDSVLKSERNRNREIKEGETVRIRNVIGKIKVFMRMDRHHSNYLVLDTNVKYHFFFLWKKRRNFKCGEEMWKMKAKTERIK